MAKAQARFIEYVLTILFSVLVVISISALVYTFYRASIEREVKGELKQLAIQTSDAVIKLYDTSKASKVLPSNYSSMMISEVKLNLPERVAKRNYEMLLISANPIWTSVSEITIDGQNVSSVKRTPGAKIVARTTQDPVVEIEYDMPNIDVAVQGRSENGANDVLKYFRYNYNTTIYDTVILGEPEILIRITSIS